MGSSRTTIASEIIAKIITGGRATTAMNTRDVLNDINLSFLNIADDANAAGGYMAIDGAGRVDITKITAASPVNKFLRDDGTWQSVLTTVPSLNSVLTTSNTTGGKNIAISNGDSITSAGGGASLSFFTGAGDSIYGTLSDGTTLILQPGNNIRLDANGLFSDYLQIGIGSNSLNSTGSNNFNAVNNIFSGLVTLGQDAATGLQAVTYQQMIALLNGLKWKENVRAKSTNNRTLSGFQTIDVVVCGAGDRVLLNDQTDPKENGLWVVASGAWSRAADADTGSELRSATVYVEAGSANGGTQWTNSNASAITIGATNITFAKIAGAGVYTNGTYLKLTGNVFDIDFTTFSTSQITEGSNLYYTNARGIGSTLTGYSSGAGTVTSSDSILSAIQKLNGNVSALVTGVSSVNSLTGAVALTGTSNRITVSAANVFDISASYVGQSSITTLGTIGTGTWQGTAVADGYISSATNWNTAYTNRITSLTVTGSSGAATLSSNVLNIPTYTLSGLGGTTLAAVNAQNLSVFAATTSAQLASIISDETGSGVLVFGTAPVFTTSITAPLIYGGSAVGSQLNLQGTSANGTSAVAAVNILVGNNGGTTALGAYNTGNLRTAGNLTLGNAGVEPLFKIHIITTTNGDFDSSMVFQNTSTGSTATDGTIMGLANGVDFYFKNQEATGRVIFKVNGSDRLAIAADGSVGLAGANTNATTMAGSQLALRTLASTGAVTGFNYTAPANTTQTTGVAIPQVLYTLANTQHAQGNIAGTYGFVSYTQPTLSFLTSSSTATLTGTVTIDGAPNSGTNAIQTTAVALLIKSAAVNGTGTVGTSYGAYINAQTGATTNYALGINGKTQLLDTVSIGSGASLMFWRGSTNAFSFNRNPDTGAITNSNAFAYQWGRVESTTNTADTLGLTVYNTAGTSVRSALFVDGRGYVGMGTSTPAALLHSLGTTEQLRLGYDASNYASYTVNSTGSLSVVLTGTAPTFTLGATNTIVHTSNANNTLVNTGSTSAQSSTVSGTRSINIQSYAADTNYIDAAGSTLRIRTTTANNMEFWINGSNVLSLTTGGLASFVSKITNSLPQNLKSYTVATLPAGTQGDVAYVTDALTPSFLVLVVGGGSTKAPVFYDGTNWVVF